MAYLRRFAPYIRREDGLHAAAWGLVGGLGAALLLNAAAWLTPFLRAGPRLALSAGIPLAAALLSFLIAYLVPRSPLAIARRSDARLGLYARLATAIEIERGQLPVPPEIAARQRADAQAAAARADPRRAFPLRLHFDRRLALSTTLLLALLVLALALPNPQDARLARQAAEQAAIERQVERLEQVRDAIAADDRMGEGTQETLLRELDDTIRDLQAGDLSREEALARLAETEEQLQALRGDDAQAAALREAGREAAQGGDTGATQEIGRALAEGDYAGAAEAIDALGEQLPQMSGAERASTTERLEAMAGAVEETNPELAQALRDAAEAIQGGDTTAAQEALRQAAGLTAEAGEQIATQEAAGQALGQVQEGRREIAQSGEGQGEQGPPAGGSGSGSGETTGEGASDGTPQAPGGPIGPNRPGQEGESPYDRVYAPERLGEGEGERIEIPGEGEEGPTDGEGDGGPAEEGEALVPYDEVYTDYQAQAASALENSYIPLGIKEYVREYFSSLEPGR